MEQQNSLNEAANKNKIIVSFDEFNISEDSFKPMTKGLGFHQESKRQNAFKAAPKEIKPFSAPHQKNSSKMLLNEISNNNKEISTKSPPVGLEAFYNAPSVVAPHLAESINSITELETNNFSMKKYNLASGASQISAWLIDTIMVLCFSIITTLVLVLVSGMSFQSFMRVVPVSDLSIFGSVLFSLYYLLYFTILDLGATPGKTIMGIKLVCLDEKEVTVRHTFIRAIVTLLSFVALLLPNIIDFQGRLSDTKVVK